MQVPKYTDNTNNQRIAKQIQKELVEEDAASELLAKIAELCLETDTAPSAEIGADRWLAALHRAGVDASLIQGGKADRDPRFIELRPSGTNGPGRSDRMLMAVSSTYVDVVKANQASHK